MAISDDELKNRFEYHAPDDIKRVAHERVRNELLAVGRLIVAMTPESREQSLAITHLEDAMFWANAAIARYPSPS